MEVARPVSPSMENGSALPAQLWVLIAAQLCVVVEAGLMAPQDSGVLTERAARPIRVLLIDDSAEFLESAARFLATDPALAIVGRTLSGAEALEQIERLKPDLVLVDLMMPEMSGLELANLLKSWPDPPRVIILTLYGIAEYAAASETALADGWVTKSTFGAQLLPLIHTLFAVGGDER
jgi:CheY-like chemotaxis protein